MPQQKKNLDHEEMARMASPTPGDTHLLAIAIDAYAHCPRLSNCVKDAKDFVALMQERYQVAPERTYTLYDEEATRPRILQELKGLRHKVGEADSLILYFSGHGDVEDEESFWVSVEGKPKEDWDWVPALRIKQLLGAVQTFHTLVIVDACFSGSFFRSYRSGSSLLHSRRSRLGMSASHSRERALDGRPGQNSPFAQELLRALRYREQPLPADMLFARVRQGVLSATKGEQTPIFSQIDVKGDDQGQYVFMPAVQAEAAWAATAALPDETILEIDAKRAELRRFCREHADSPHFDDAVELGLQLEHKREFLSHYNSEFGLLRFARKATPYREAAKQRLAELEAQATASAPTEEARRSRQPQPQPQPHPSPDDEAKRSRQPKPTTPLAQLEAGMLRIPGGTFTMGYLDGRDGEGYGSEKPHHEVTVPTFHIGKYPVTQAQWRAVMGSDPPELYNKGCDDCPVERVSWDDVQTFLRKLNALTGKYYRLPTEAEWEYAARGGSQSKAYLYSGSNNIGEVAWYSDNAQEGNTHGAEKTTRPVGQQQANELGLYDMSGNVWEWVEDDWHGNYDGAPRDGRAWVDSPRASPRVYRGGGWYDGPRNCRAAARTTRRRPASTTSAFASPSSFEAAIQLVSSGQPSPVRLPRNGVKPFQGKCVGPVSAADKGHKAGQRQAAAVGTWAAG